MQVVREDLHVRPWGACYQNEASNSRASRCLGDTARIVTNRELTDLQQARQSATLWKATQAHLGTSVLLTR